MTIVVINSGSSSIKFSLYRTIPGEPRRQGVAPPECLMEGQVSSIGTPEAQLEVQSNTFGAVQPSHPVQAGTPAEAVHVVLDAVAAPGMPSIDAAGYRVVHPGPRLTDHTRITEEVLADLAQAASFAPLHDPAVLDLIRETMSRFPRIGHFACFDTVFHNTMPPEATTYPIAQPLRDAGVRRYGFHGLSCESVLYQLRNHVPHHSLPSRMVIAHLGSGSSVTAVVDGCSADNTMGLTPTGGVLMGTRPGDLDPGLIFYLLRQPNATVDSVEHFLNFESGLRALAQSSDVRKLRETSDRSPEARLALEIFCRRVRMAIAGFAAVYGLDALVFTGGIGEHDAPTRLQTANHLFAGQPRISETANNAKSAGVRTISAAESTIPIYIVPAEEDLMIAWHVARMAS